MKILEWNINQRSNYNQRGFIPEWLNVEIKKTNADIVVCTDPQKLDQNLTIRRSVFLWQNIVLNSRRKLF